MWLGWLPCADLLKAYPFELLLYVQTLEKQEVDRVDFLKKQIMLYVFLRKEVNEICEKVCSNRYEMHSFYEYADVSFV